MTEEKREIKETTLTGKIFIFTGELKTMSRTDAQKLVESLGAKYVSAISKNVDYVVAGPNAGSKLDKAKGFKLSVISEGEFLRLTAQ